MWMIKHRNVVLLSRKSSLSRMSFRIPIVNNSGTIFPQIQSWFSYPFALNLLNHSKWHTKYSYSCIYFNLSYFQRRFSRVSQKVDPLTRLLHLYPYYISNEWPLHSSIRANAKTKLINAMHDLVHQAKDMDSSM